MTLYHYVGLSILLFVVGAAGFVLRRNTIILLLCVEIMLNAVNLSLVAFARYLYGTEGQIFVFMIMTVAAAEAAVGLAIVVGVYRLFKTVDTGRIKFLRG